jgi:hypothetical protein
MTTRTSNAAASILARVRSIGAAAVLDMGVSILSGAEPDNCSYVDDGFRNAKLPGVAPSAWAAGRDALERHSSLSYERGQFRSYNQSYPKRNVAYSLQALCQPRPRQMMIPGERRTQDHAVQELTSGSELRCSRLDRATGYALGAWCNHAAGAIADSGRLHRAATKT